MRARRDELPAEGFNLLDVELSRLLGRRAARPGGGLALGAALASRQRRVGHPCLLLKEWAGREHGLGASGAGGCADELPARCPELAGWMEELAASGVVAVEAREAGAFPLVLEDGRLYLQRMHAAELRVARALTERLRPLVPPGGWERLLERVAPRAEVDPEQRQALEAVLQRPLHVLTGGPGTGKTSTLGRMLALALALQPGLRIRLAAPTGKAAARLQEALASTLERLPGEFRGAVAALPRAGTLHRLLHDNPPVDWLVVDEASMVDLSLLDRVLAQLPGQARLLLVGDADQLASVDAGAVLHHVVEGLERLQARGAGPPLVTRLARSRRFSADSGIGRLAQAVRQGHVDEVLETLRHPTDDLRWLRHGQAGAGAEFSALLEDGLAPFCRATEPAEALAALERFRVVCARRTGRLGVEAVNRWCRGRFMDGGNSAFSPLLIRVNDHVLGLANGDSGVRSRGAEGEALCHLQPGGPGLACLAEAQLPPHDEAWAITVHQSQGSEADEVLLLLPEAGSPLLGRELLYTGLTRARRRLTLVGSREALRQAVERRSVRAGGLADRLASATHDGSDGESA
jgi:exodeoxyribonuclease V alpha subunit